MIGKKFGLLTVLEELNERKWNAKVYRCKCECGNYKNVVGTDLRRNVVRSCGCLQGVHHGKSNSRLYKIFIDMKRRCYDKRNKNYPNYGARGITICAEWLNDFMTFYNWSINNGYQDNLTIDRIDNDKGYSPSNCRWATNEDQQNNTRATIKIQYKNMNYSISQWGRILNIDDSVLRKRYHDNWDIKRLLTKRNDGKYLYPHQVEVLGRLYKYNKCAMFLEMGLGKTITGAIKSTSYHKPILIICPKSLIDQWIDCFKVWCKDYNVYDLTDTKQLQSFMNDTQDQKMGIISYSMYWRRDILLKLSDFTLLLDESHNIANSTSKQSKFCTRLKAENIILLTGSPASNSRYDKLYTQLKLLGLNMNKRSYEDRYCNFFDMEKAGVRFRVLSKTNPYKNVDELKSTMYDLGCVFMKTDEVIELPQQRFIDVPIKPSKYYKTFVKDGYVDCGEYEYISSSPTTDMLYQRQLCNSAEKLDMVKTLLESTEDRVIIFYNFNCELELLQQLVSKLKRPLSFVNGSEKNLNCYNNNNDSVTLVQYQSGSSGVNLQKANKMIYFSPPIKSDFYEQSKKRIHRIGQDHKCVYYKLVTTNSIEQKIYNTLDQKRDFTEELFKHE